MAPEAAEGVHLSLVALASIVPGGDISEIQNVNVSKRRLKSVEDLSQCRSLARLNVAHNCLEGDLSFATFCLQLRWINASSNKLTTLGGLKNLSFLEVLNVSNNEISSLDGLEATGATLTCFVAAHNQISAVDVLHKLPKLQTLGTYVCR
eukprot:GHVU01014003.1.p1 GENE.GHVU01014003.1~~GHVU01014003.1.p1  ORF type:complete len:150 (-),score=16.90 GHVU01014003.1:399-848(-)